MVKIGKLKGALLSLILLCVYFAQASPVLDSSCAIKSASEILRLVDRSISFETDSDTSSPLPFTTISYAQTLDGSIAPLARTRMNISSSCSISLLHSLRAHHDAILVGINTIICDQPLLNVRNPLPGIPKISPRPIIIDSNLRIANLETVRIQNPIICTTLNSSHEKWDTALAKLDKFCGGGNIITCKIDSDGRCDLYDCFVKLKSIFGLKSVLVEGGAHILQSVLEKKIANQIVLTMRPGFFGGYRAMTRELPSTMSLQDITVATLGGDIIIHGKFHSNSPSHNNLNSNRNNACVSKSSTGEGFSVGSSADNERCDDTSVDESVTVEEGSVDDDRGVVTFL